MSWRHVFWGWGAAPVSGGSAQVPVVGLVLLLKTRSLVNSRADFSGHGPVVGWLRKRNWARMYVRAQWFASLMPGPLLVLDPVGGGGVLCRRFPGLSLSGGCPGLGLSAPSASLLQGVALLLFSGLLLVRVGHVDYSLGGTCAALRYHP